MTFLAPYFLIGLTAVSVPLIIHFLARRSKRSVDFSSILYLREIQRSSITWYAIREKYLLYIRSLLLIIVPIALSRPLCIDTNSPSIDILVIDRSASMDGKHGAVWNEAMKISRDFLRRNRGAIHSVWTAGECLTFAADGSTLHEGDDFLTFLSPTGETFACESIVSELRAWMREIGIEHLRVHLISDFQSGNWVEAGVELPNVKIFGIPVTGVTENISIEGVDIIDLPSLMNGVLIAQIELGNHGTEDISTHLSILWGGEKHTVPVTIPPGGSYMESPLGPITDGFMQGYVSVEDSAGITADNRRDLLYPVPDTPNIVILGGSDEERHRVLSVLVPSPVFETDFRVKKFEKTQIVPSDLDDASVVIIFPTAISETLHDAIIYHYSRGMGIVFICSHPNLPPSWIDLTEDIIGARPGAETIPASQVDEAYTPASSLHHPILSVFRNVGGVTLPHVWRVFKWPSSRGRVLLDLSNHMPLLVEKSLGGGGKALIWMTGFLPPMSDWSSRSSFVPLFRRSISYAASDLNICTGKIGASVNLAVVCPTTRCAFNMEYPDGSVIPVHGRYDRAGRAYVHVMLGYHPGAHVIRRENQVVAVCHAVIDSTERIPDSQGYRPKSVRFGSGYGEHSVVATDSGPGISTILLLVAGLCMLVEGIITGRLSIRQRRGR